MEMYRRPRKEHLFNRLLPIMLMVTLILVMHAITGVVQEIQDMDTDMDIPLSSIRHSLTME